MKELRSWKKVFIGDLDSIIYELKECVDTPCVIILSGEVGAGKTTFVKSFVEIVCADESRGEANSPTYSVINEIGSVVHADFYRLKSPEEILHLEVPLYTEDKEYFLIEWGREYLGPLREIVSDDFVYFELKIELNEIRDGQEDASRNFYLTKFD